MPAVATDPAPGQETFEALLPEADERAGADHAGDLALERLVVVLTQAALEEECEADVERRALDLQRAALSGRRRRAGLLHLGGVRAGVVDAQRGQQSAVDDDVRIAPDRRREVAVAGTREPGVAEVFGRVVRLLERAQDERREDRTAAARLSHVSGDEATDLADRVGRLLRRHGLRDRWR